MATYAGAGKKLQSERAVRVLRSRILSGEFGPDTHISETAAAEMMGISRTPTREALAQLVDEGLLDRTSSGRCTVRSFSADDVIDAIELRGVLEGTIVRLAAERGPSRDDFDRCMELADLIDIALGDAEPEIDFERYADLNAEFHRTLIGLSGSVTLRREAERAYRMPLASPSAFLQSQEHLVPVRRSLYVAQAQHRALLDAIAAREGARAEMLAREHARLARQNLDALMQSEDRHVHDIPGLSMLAGTPQVNTKGRTQ